MRREKKWACLLTSDAISTAIASVHGLVAIVLMAVRATFYDDFYDKVLDFLSKKRIFADDSHYITSTNMKRPTLP